MSSTQQRAAANDDFKI